MNNQDRFGLIGNTIAGTFRVDKVIAEGGFGVVYRAFHLHFRSPVALKCLKIPGELSEEESIQFLEQFRSEAEIQFRLSAELPHIVRPLHVDAVHSDDGEFVPLMVLEWLEGESFDQIIEGRVFAEKPPMSLEEAMTLIGPAAHALHQAHNFTSGGETLTVVHRDIKPDNLFVTEIGGKKVVKILDFGISKVRRAATQLAGHFSQTSGQAPFSPAYGAPEQWVPKRLGQTGPWTDVWGLALTLVEIIKGDAVVVGDHQAMMGTILDPKSRPSPRNEGVKVSDEVESVFLKALSLDPRYRYQTIESFWESLQAAVLMSRAGSRSYDETPSGRRIALPRMSAPTPWTSPLKATAPEAIGKLPPMVAPSLMDPAHSELKTAPEHSMPTDPRAGLHPVQAADTSWENFDPNIPPSSRDPGYVEQPDPLSSFPAVTPPLTPPPIQEKDPSIKLELAATSNFPEWKSSPNWSKSPIQAEAPAPPPLEPQSPTARAPSPSPTSTPPEPPEHSSESRLLAQPNRSPGTVRPPPPQRSAAPHRSAAAPHQSAGAPSDEVSRKSVRPPPPKRSRSPDNPPSPPSSRKKHPSPPQKNDSASSEANSDVAPLSLIPTSGRSTG